MYYVYRMQSLENPKKSFIGTTRNVKKRLAMHNRGKVSQTATDAPWRISFYAAFTRKERADAFKSFLRTSEGKKLGREYFWSVRSGVKSSHAEQA